MPVYYDEKESRIDFIKKHPSFINFDSMTFMLFVYSSYDLGGSEKSFADYSEFIDTVQEKFPTANVAQIITDISCAIEDVEQETYRAWMHYADC